MQRDQGIRPDDEAASTDAEGRVPLGRGLSVKLLVLTAIFVLLAEMIIFPPSAANFRLRWMQDKLNTATVAGLLIMKSGSDEISREVQNALLMATGARAIAARENGMARLLASTEMPPAVDEQIDLAMAGNPVTSIRDAMSTLTETVEDTKVYQQQLGALNKNLTSLNSVYGNILNAYNQGPRV